jgi:ectoine hydroxylase-related dioxygenase (phytanoyl-CoA dioxygenase family)
MPQEAMQVDPQIRVVLSAGGILIFSGAQMHSTVPNTSGKTRFSIDFRTVHRDGVSSKCGAPNIDSVSSDTSLGDFLRASDLAHVPGEWVAAYDTPLATDDSSVEV